MTGLRPRQIKAIDDLRAAYSNGFRAPVLVAPTGFGKTHTTAVVVRSALERGKRVWFMAHLREILEDTSRKLYAESIRHGLILAGMPCDLRHQVQVVSVQTAARRIHRLPHPDLLIIDEAHLAVADTYRKVIDGTGSPLLLLLTATPERLDGRGLGEIADVIVPTCSTQDLIDEGLLSPIRYFAPQIQDLSGVGSVAGDYNRAELSAHMDKPAIIGSCVQHYRKLAHGRQAIAFCCSIEHAQHTAAQFQGAGYRAVAISGESDTSERRQALADLKAGRLDVVCNCALWVAGVDAPNVSCIILLAPSKSLTRYLQSVGRGLRIADGKEDVVILDHANLAMMHGLPTEAREWTLEGSRGKKKKRDPDDVPVKQCPDCYRIVRAQAQRCVCGKVWVPQGRMVAEHAGELTEVDPSLLRRERMREQASAKSLDDLIRLGAARGYRNPRAWALHIYQARTSRA